MRKFFICTLIFVFLSYLYNPKKLCEIDVYVSETDSIVNEYIKIKEDKVSFYFNGNYLFSFESENVTDDFDYYVFNNEMHIILKDDLSIEYLIYNDMNKKISDEFIDVNLNYDSKLKLHFINNCPYILFTSNDDFDDYKKEANITLLRFDEDYELVESIVYGGYFNESLIDSYVRDDSLYLFLRREKNSGGDFSNHGNYCLALLRDCEIVNKLYFDDDIFNNIVFSDDLIRLSFDDLIYSFDYSFNQLEGLKFDRESIYSLVSFNKLLMQINENRLNIYDLYTNKELYVYDFDYLLYDYNLEGVYILYDSIYLIFNNLYNLKYLKLDIFDTRDFVSEINYLNGLSQYNLSVDSWNNKCKCFCDYSSVDVSVNGTYELKYCFNDFYKIMKVNVLEYENVFEGGIYPLNYKLKFSGKAFLNGKMIDYGYVINNCGEYKLEIYDNNKEKRTINFSVNENQVFFDLECFKKSDYVLVEEQSLFINFLINKNYLIQKVIVNDMEWTDWNYNNEILNIEFNEDDYGFYYYNINYIILENRETKEEVKMNINEIVSIMVLNKELSIDLNFSNTKDSFIFNYELENEECLRFLKMYVNDQYYKSIDFVDSDIKLPFNLNVYNVRINLVYELGDNKLYEKELFSVKYDSNSGTDFARLNISFKESSLNSFSLYTFKDEAIKEINCDSEMLYFRQENNDNYLLFLFLFIFVFISFLTVIYYVKKIKVNKTRIDKYPLKKQ